MANTDLIERLTLHAASWRRDDAFKARDPEAEAAIAEEAATAITASRAECEGLRDQIDAAREFVQRHPSLTLIDLAEFEAFLKVPSVMRAAFSQKVTGCE